MYVSEAGISKHGVTYSERDRGLSHQRQPGRGHESPSTISVPSSFPSQGDRRGQGGSQPSPQPLPPHYPLPWRCWLTSLAPHEWQRKQLVQSRGALLACRGWSGGYRPPRTLTSERGRYLVEGDGGRLLITPTLITPGDGIAPHGPGPPHEAPPPTSELYWSKIRCFTILSSPVTQLMLVHYPYRKDQ